MFIRESLRSKKFYFVRFAKVYAREMQKFREFFGSRKILLLKYYVSLSFTYLFYLFFLLFIYLFLGFVFYFLFRIAFSFLFTYLFYLPYSRKLTHNDFNANEDQ